MKRAAHATALVAATALGAAFHSATVPQGEPLAKQVRKVYQVPADSDYCKALDVFASDTLNIAPHEDLSVRITRDATDSVCYRVSASQNQNGQIEAGNELCEALDDMIESTLCADSQCKPEQLVGALRAARPTTRSVCWMLVGDFGLPGEWRAE